MRRAVVSGAFLAFASLVVTLGTFDVGLRYADWAYRPTPRAIRGEFASRPSENFVTDPDTGWRMRPGHAFRWNIDGHVNEYRANRQGFRSDLDFEHPDRPVTAFLGDSFTFGTGVDYVATYPHLVQELRPGTVAHSYAMPGFGVDQMWRSLSHQALPNKPTFVVVGFIDQDLDRSLTAFRQGEGMAKPRFVLDAGTLRLEQPRDAPGRLWRWLDGNSSLWTAIEVARQKYARTHGGGEWFELNAEIFAAMHEESRAKGIPVLFVRMPERGHIPFPALERFMAARHMNYLDLSVDAPDGLHFATDAHINARGHAFVASRIARTMAGLQH